MILLVLQFASIGVVDHAGTKVSLFTFFGRDSGIKAKEPPLNRLLTIGIGVSFQPLYDLLPTGTIGRSKSNIFSFRSVKQ